MKVHKNQYPKVSKKSRGDRIYQGVYEQDINVNT